jgi:hypothetical protein
MKLKSAIFFFFVFIASKRIDADAAALTIEITNVPVPAVSSAPAKDASAAPESKTPITIAILKTSGPRKTLAVNITELLGVNLSSDPRFVLVDRTELDKVLDEQALGKSGEITPETAAKIGQLTGAQILVSGREFSTSEGNVVVIADIISTANGRVFSQTVQGMRSDQVTLVSNLSQKIEQVISDESPKLLATAADSAEEQLNMVIEKIKGKAQPAVLIKINETMPGGADSIAQNELERVFQAAGFTVVDEKSHQREDILITGDALATSVAPQGNRSSSQSTLEIKTDGQDVLMTKNASSGATQGNLYSGQATLEIKARDEATGKILMLDFQKGTAVDITNQTAMEQALKNATDLLAERMLPILAH